MASIFKRGRDKGKRRAHWYVSYTDHLGRRRTKKGFTDKTLSEQLGAKLENEAMLRQRGLIDPDDERIANQKATLLSVHLEAFERSLAPNSEKYVKLLMNRIRRLVKECGFEVAGDMNPDKVAETLAAIWEKEKFGHRTYNHYVQAINSFGNWLVTSRRLPSNPVIGLERLNPDVDVRHPRRALTPEEVAKLVESARTSDEEIQCYSGEARARVYITSYMTGLRRKELSSLTPRSFDLDGDPPTVTVQATVSKHRKKDVLPLHPELVSMVKEWIVGLDADEPLFLGLDFRRTWLMVQKDLERAGIPYETAEGIADFHAAGRHSHVTELLRSGASLPEARELARHADVRTTMKYTHIGMEDRARALGNLRWQRIGSGARDVRGHGVASNDNGKASPNGDDPDRSSEKSKGYDTASHRVSSNGNGRAKAAVQIRFPPPPVFVCRQANEDCHGAASRAEPGSIEVWNERRTTPWQAGRSSAMGDKFWYVYLLRSIEQVDRLDVGMTEHLEERLAAHNSGSCTHTSRFAPWRIETAIAFRHKAKAIAFERYLKSHSGRAFAVKHF